ncbi:MAG: tRNA epoxyqueuosine(34) reductase QueG [Pseudomonadota bacterium]
MRASILSLCESLRDPESLVGTISAIDKTTIRRWAKEAGFSSAGFADIDLQAAEQRLVRWLADGLHGSMAYFDTHGTKRARPSELVPGTLSVVSVTCDYLPEPNDALPERLDHPSRAYISRYALGRDYHKRVRRRLQRLAERVQNAIGPFGYRAFCDSAPVLEKPLAAKAGLGWIGKHTNLITKHKGSWFFIGELYTDLPLASDPPAADHCGSCTRCIDVCPTDAIIAPYVLDARRCIAYLTIENRNAIPVEFRKALGNRVFGCDDCQIFCPWNKFAAPTDDKDFQPRHGLDEADLVSLFNWTEDEFDVRTQGSPIRRIGYVGWLRNLAVGLGNAAYCASVVDALQRRQHHPNELVHEHVNWALEQQQEKKNRV